MSMPFAGVGFHPIPHYQQVRGGIYGDAALTGGIAGGYVPSPSMIANGNLAKLASILNLTAQGNLLSKVPFQAEDYKFLVEGAKGIKMNGVALGTLVTNIAQVQNVRSVGETVISWEQEDVNVFADNINVPVTKTVVCDKICEDVRGTKYARIITTYRAGVWVGSNVNLWNTREFSTGFDVQTVVEYVVVGFRYDEINENIWIPNCVVVTEVDENGVEVIRNYPVREIWGGVIEAATVDNPTLHTLTVQELSKSNNVLNVPKSISAPYINKISLKRRLIGRDMTLFTGCCPKAVYLPLLESIVGGGKHTKTPIFCSNNSEKYHLSHLRFPALRSIKNCIFASQLAALKSIEVPMLERIEETVFCANCPSLKALNLPSIEYIIGCDYFCANDYNMKELHFTNGIKLRPHVPYTSSASDSLEGAALLRQTLAILALGQYNTLINSTNSMSYFCNGCSKLMNASADYAIEGATVGAKPFDKITTVGVDRHRGIFTDYVSKFDATGMNPQDKSYYGHEMILELSEFAHRLGSTAYDTAYTPAATDELKFNVKPEGGNISNFYLEPTFKLIVGKIGDDYYVIPIDPRTALMNTMTSPRVANTLFASSTATHAWDDSVAPAMLFTVNPSVSVFPALDGVAGTTTVGSEIFNEMMGVNQIYNTKIN